MSIIYPFADAGSGGNSRAADSIPSSPPQSPAPPTARARQRRVSVCCGGALALLLGMLVVWLWQFQPWLTQDIYTDADSRLSAAALYGDRAGLQRALADGGRLDSRCGLKLTPLMWACKCGHVAAAHDLLDAGADIDARTDDGWTALMFAAERGHAEVVTLLVQHGADPQLLAQPHPTARDLAQVQGHDEIPPRPPAPSR